MSIPAELSLVSKYRKYHLKFQPVRELQAVLSPIHQLEKGKNHTRLPLNGTPLDIHISWKAQKKGITKLSLGNYEIIVDFVRETIRFNDLEKHADTAFIAFSHKENLDLRLIIDQEVLEFFGNHGIIYGAVEMEENILRSTLTVESNAEISSMEWCEIRVQA